MSRTYRRQMLHTVDLLEKANKALEKALPQGRAAEDRIGQLLTDCQNTAITMGNGLEAVYGEGTDSVRELENYCENLYQIYISSASLPRRRRLLETIKGQLKKLRSLVEAQLPDRLEVVFLPYKASMWDSLESVWRAAKEDTECDAYVVPIPYYDRNPDFSLGSWHYEGGDFPDDVPVTHYEAYDFEHRQPDVIFFHNPYDGRNLVTSVQPFFYAENLRKFTDVLVYIPYYIVPGAIPEHFVLSQGVFYADLVFVQCESIRGQYIRTLEKSGYSIKRKRLEDKIVALGSPKSDKLIYNMVNKPLVPETWSRQIGDRCVVFFNTNVSLLLNNGEYFVENLYRIFRIFEEYGDRFILLWREHPLTMATLKSMRQGLMDDYQKLKKDFEENRWGILDDTEEPHLAMAVSDCYFGAGGSLVTLYSVTGKPMLVTDYHYPKGISDTIISKEEFYSSIGGRVYYKEEHINSLRLFLDNYEEICTFRDKRIEVISKRLANLDGSVGEKIYAYVTGKKTK